MGKQRISATYRNHAKRLAQKIKRGQKAYDKHMARVVEQERKTLKTP